MDAFNGWQDTESHWSEGGSLGKTAPPQPSLEGFHGAVTFATGEVARCIGVEAITFGAAGEPFQGVMILVLPDGSTGWQSFAGQVESMEPDGAIRGQGTWAWIGGNGQFRGLQGGGSLTFRYTGSRWEATFTGRGAQGPALDGR